MFLLKKGDMILLRTSHGKRIREFITVVSDEDYHTDLGIIYMNDILQSSIGDTVQSHKGHTFLIHRPRTPDFFRHAKRTGAPMMPKDIGMIIAYTGLNKNDVVLDSGTGSGILAMYLGSIAKKVISYEIKEDFAEVARQNIINAGLDNVEVRCGDIVEEVKNLDQAFDVITLDTMHSMKVIPHVINILQTGGYVATYSPFIEQTKEIRQSFGEAGFSDVVTLECIEREISFSDRGTRPSTARVGHTGFITIARK